MSRPSWEEVVNRVTISSNYLDVQLAARRWDQTFERIKTASKLIRDLIARSSTTWTGTAADAVYDHLERTARALDAVIEHHQSIAGAGGALAKSGEALETAVRAIPIPAWMEGQIQDKLRMYVERGVQDPIPISSIRHWLHENVSPANYVWENWLGSYELIAQIYYERLEDAYRIQAGRMPDPVEVTPPRVAVDAAARLGGGGRDGAGAVRPPGLPTAASTMPIGGLPTGLTGTGLPTATNLPTVPDLAQFTPPTTPDLSSVDDPDLPELGGGLAGLGGGGGGALPELGPTAAIDPSAMRGVASEAMASQQAGRLGGPAGSGLAGNAALAGAGMVPYGGGAVGQPPGGMGEETGTKLHEDERDVIFGTGTQDLPGDVLD